MNQSQSYNLESTFGPPSEPISIIKFLEATKSESSMNLDNGQIHEGLEDECSVEEIRATLATTWSDPLLSSTLMKDHTHTVGMLASVGNARTSKSARNSQHASQSSSEDVIAVQKDIQSILLSSWGLNADAVQFMRTSKNSDYNILQQFKFHGEITDSSDPSTAVLTVSVYNRVSWGPSYVTRLSQHALLSTQTLADLYTIFPCAYKTLPNQQLTDADGCFICIEGVIYGDGTAEPDYATKLTAHLDAFKRNDKSVHKASTPLSTTTISSLTLRLNEPYWLVHQGNCEHFIIVDQIRLLHPSDRRSGFPLTLQITPPLLDLCRSCQRVPAVASVVGDIRLGESPCVLCGPCWKQMGELPHDTEVLVRPLPNYKVTQ
ncbi:snRNA-activating protein of 50kDa MW C terminal-domain-containing protein [Panaeolus papilionaceus]|nr:snRNA-activating protein of 50kDa MW C terminal-domain-containing protein [Panaeolus papilionaceus]